MSSRQRRHADSEERFVLRRRDVLRGIRRLIFALDSRTELRTFLRWAAVHLAEHSGAAGCGIAVRYGEAAREFCLFVSMDEEPRESVRSLGRDEWDRELPDPQGRDGYEGCFYSGVEELRRELGVPAGRVVSAAVRSGERVVAGVDLVDPDPFVIPDAGTLEGFLQEVSAAFELALLHTQLRQERLEAHLLRKVGMELGRTLDLDEVLDSLLDLLRRIVPYDAAVIYLLGDDGLDVVRQSLRGYGEQQQEAVPLKMGQGIVGSVARSGRSEIIPDVKRDPRYFEVRPCTASEMVAPLKSGGRVLGVFNLESDRKDAYTIHDLRLLEIFAGQAAVALERARLLAEEESKRRMDQELRIARRIQRYFLPAPRPEFRETGPAGRTLPCEQVSGDYFDFVVRDDGSVALVVADVSGKGMPAALIMATMRAAFRLGAAKRNDPAAFCADLNEFLYGSLRETEFVTGVVGILDRDRTRLVYCNAGHNPPFVLRRDGTVEWLETGGILLGAFPGMSYTAGRVDLAEGDLVVFYTDGATEPVNPAGEEYGTERLLEVVRKHRGETPRNLAGTVIASVREFVQGPLPDDVTVVAVVGGKKRR